MKRMLGGLVVLLSLFTITTANADKVGNENFASYMEPSHGAIVYGVASEIKDAGGIYSDDFVDFDLNNKTVVVKKNVKKLGVYDYGNYNIIVKDDVTIDDVFFTEGFEMTGDITYTITALKTFKFKLNLWASGPEDFTESTFKLMLKYVKVSDDCTITLDNGYAVVAKKVEQKVEEKTDETTKEETTTKEEEKADESVKEETTKEEIKQVKEVTSKEGINFKSNDLLVKNAWLKTVKQDYTDNNLKLDGYELLVGYEITMYDDNGVVPMENGSFEIRIPVDNNNYDKYKVLYLKNGEIEQGFDAKYENGYVVFNTTHLSEYVVFGTNKTIEEEKEENPKTGDNIVTLVSMLTVVSTLLTGLVLKLKKN